MRAAVLCLAAVCYACIPVGAQTPSGAPAAPEPSSRLTVRLTGANLLHLRFTEVALQEVTLREAFEWLVRATGSNLVVRWDKLDEVGVTDETVVSVRARNMRLRQVLWMILNQAAPPEGKLAYRISNDMILISTEADLSQEMLVRVYDVTSIIATELATPEIGMGRTHEIPTITGLGVAPGAAGVNVRPQVFDSGVRIRSFNVSGVDEDEEAGSSFELRMQELINVIMATVEPDSWDVNGGNGTIRAYRGLLVVRNTPFVHQKLGGPIDESEAP